MIHIIVPGYNCDRYVHSCLTSLAEQTYSNFIAYIIDDASTDNTLAEIREFRDSRFKVVSNRKNVKSLANYAAVAYYIENDEDIVVRLDMDDWLAHKNVLQNIIDIYADPNILLTYGTWKTYPQNQIGDHMCISIPDLVNQQNAYRQWGFHFSHLKTHRAGLFKKVKISDLIDPVTNTFYAACDDLAYIFPMVEMAGKSRIYLNRDVNLILNRENPLNEGKVMTGEIQRITNYIRAQKPYDRLP